MGFRFRRTFRVLPGVRLNLSTRGVSTSFGVRGAHITVSDQGTRTTVGVPETGMSYTEFSKADRPPLEPTPKVVLNIWPAVLVVGWIVTVVLAIAFIPH